MARSLYVPAMTRRRTPSLVWVDRYGRTEPFGMTPRRYHPSFRQLSPDEPAAGVESDGDLVLYDLETQIRAAVHVSNRR